jgi:hypothetical protein
LKYCLAAGRLIIRYASHQGAVWWKMRGATPERMDGVWIFSFTFFCAMTGIHFSFVQ